MIHPARTSAKTPGPCPAANGSRPGEAACRARRRPSGAERGSALTEILLCLLPYTLLLFGVLLLFQLTMGNLEAAKAVAWLAGDPAALGEADVRRHFFIRDPGRVAVAGKMTDESPEPPDDAEEPVYPYGELLGGGETDLVAAIHRSLTYSLNADAVMRVHDTQKVGRMLLDTGVVDAGSYNSATGARITVDFDNPSDTAMPRLEITLEGEDILRDVAEIMGSGTSRFPERRQVSYVWAGIDSYTGGLADLGLGDAHPPLESEGEDRQRLRGPFTLRGREDLGDQRLAEMEVTVENPEAGRGRHHPGQTPDVRVDWIPEMVWTGAGVANAWNGAPLTALADLTDDDCRPDRSQD